MGVSRIAVRVPCSTFQSIYPLRSGRRCFHNTPTAWERPTKPPVDIQQILQEPTWSVESLLPPKDVTAESPTIAPEQFRKLLRLSALPLPKNAEEEASMLSTLSSQLHFAKEIQKVDTTGVAPLQSLRDETTAGQTEQEIGLEALESAFRLEESRGTYYKKIRRRQDGVSDTEGVEQWDPLKAAQKRVGRYFVVEGGKEG
ncbi:hypothetical protein M8818_006476 [Zalaria obscura]|uniref:Uncharacterized protein n=1 Tax=Zalaria obscura TaxID=2024903 RepID=A0ACC3S6T9_9PEZI